MSKVTNDDLRMLYSCTHLETLGVKGLNHNSAKDSCMETM